MESIILAAGTGSRLLSLTREVPKALVTVHGKQLLDYAIDFSNLAGCLTPKVVGGFYFDKLKDYVSGKPNILLYENPDFLKGSILSILKALPFIQDSFLLINVDHIYPARLARKLAEELIKLDRVTAVVDFDRPLSDDDMKVLVTEQWEVKKISKTLSQFDAGYVGLTYVPKNALSNYRSVVERIAGREPESNVERVLQLLVDEGQPPSILDISGTRWLEVDNQTDMNNAERILRNVPGFLD